MIPIPACYYFSDDLKLLLVLAHAELPDDEDDRREALTRCVAWLQEQDRELLEACYADEGVNAMAGRMGRSP